MNTDFIDMIMSYLNVIILVFIGIIMYYIYRIIGYLKVLHNQNKHLIMRLEEIGYVVQDIKKSVNSKDNNVIIEEVVVKYNDDIKPNDGQEKALEILKDKRNKYVFITGGAGTGKSYVLQKWYEELTNAVVIAPTGIAAKNIGGCTFDSFMKTDYNKRGITLSEQTEYINKLYKYDTNKKRFDTIKTIIIDEISMVRADTFDFLDRFLCKYRESTEPFGGVRIVVFGDLYQLAPIASNKTDTDKEINKKLTETYNEDKDTLWFYKSTIFKAMKDDLKMYELTESVRQSGDKLFINILHQMRYNDKVVDTHLLEKRVDKITAHNIDYKGIILGTTNDIVDDINKNKLEQVEGKEIEIKLEVKVIKSNITTEEDAKKRIKKDYNLDDTLTLKKEARVIITQNDTKKQYVNGSMGTLKDIKDDTLEVLLDDGKTVKIPKTRYDYNTLVPQKDGISYEIEAVAYGYQYPVRIGYAMTVHKSQGMTLERMHIQGVFFAHGHCYTAYSRCKTLDGITLEHSFSNTYNTNKHHTYNEVETFYKSIMI